jgi:endonuclease YncB( thermonuclease family)
VTGGIDVQRMLIRSGFAVSEYGEDYQQDEAVAAKQARGMWAGSFQRPKDWRKAQRGG